MRTMAVVKQADRSDYTLYGINDVYETRCTHPGCHHHYRSHDEAEVVERIENHARTHKISAIQERTASPDDIAKIKKAINECDAFGSVSIWLYPDGHVDVVSWHGGESATQKQMAQGTMRLHWDPKTFIVQYTPPMTPIQGVAMYDIFENVRNSNVEIMVPGAGITGDRTGNPKSQMETLRSTNRKTGSTQAFRKHTSVTVRDASHALMSTEYNKMLAEWTGGYGNTAVFGGCRVAAEALQKIFGGEIYALIADRDIDDPTYVPMVQHYVVKNGGGFIDARGRVSEHELTNDDDFYFADKLTPATPALIEYNRNIWSSPDAVRKTVDFIEGNA